MSLSEPPERGAAKNCEGNFVAKAGTLTFAPGENRDLPQFRALEMLHAVMNRELFDRHEIVEKNENCPLAHARLGILLGKRGRYEKAADHFSEVVRRDPGSFDDRLVLATFRAKAGQLNQAAAEFRVALSLRPDSAEAHVGLAGTLRGLGQLDDAARHLAEASRLDPNSAELHDMLGIIRLEQGRWEAAAEQFRAALQLSPNDPEIMERLNVVTRELRKLKSP